MKSLLHLLPYLKKYKTHITWGCVAAVFTTGISALAPWILKLAVDDLRETVTAGKLAMYGGLFVGTALVGGVFRYYMRMLLIGMSRKVEQDLRDRVFSHLQAQPVMYYTRHRTGDLMARMTNDLDSVRNVLGPGFMYPIDTGLTAIFSLVLMLMLSVKLTLLTLLITPLVSWSVFKLGKVTHRLTTDIQEQYSRLSEQAQENLSGARVVRAFSQEQQEIEKFDELNQEYVSRNLSMTRVQALFFPLMGFLFEVGAALILLVGGFGIIRGEMTLGDFVAFVGYLGMLAWPMIAIGWVANLLQRGAASMKRIQEMLDTEPEIQSAALPKSPSARTGRVEFRGVRFMYSPTSPSLGVLDFTIEAGQTVAFVGATGSGKTTLINLIPRLLDPTEGQVLIDGVPTTEWDLAELRRCVAMVPQDAFMFSETVYNNLVFGNPAASRDQAMASARVSRIDKDVETFSAGYETMVGERGVTLSGGQKGRLALARALVRDPLILILDDALSAVDTHTEEEILSGLRSFMKHRTSILISHRVSTVREADRIFVLREGAIVEEGTHSELLENNGIYADMERRQRLEAELEMTE
ncbi:MAG: ABC transporter ATP-binding protein [Calditrichaeota bacterium]|nr:ABC transporter ATP-binding protein [Calditrichota bacterium]MCB9366744.1 ABC transporter ATP-binding protein [Calditrichota bacterium]